MIVWEITLRISYKHDVINQKTFLTSSKEAAAAEEKRLRLLLEELGLESCGIIWATAKEIK